MFKNLSKCSSSHASDRVDLEICQSCSNHASESRIKYLSKTSNSHASDRVDLEICQSLVVVMQVTEST